MEFDSDLRELLSAIKQEAIPHPGMELMCHMRALSAEKDAANCNDPDRAADLQQMAVGWRWLEEKARRKD